MSKTNNWLVLLVAIAATLLAGMTGVAQEDSETNAEAAANEEAGESSLQWEQGVFVLMLVAIVMGGLVGFEYIGRKRRSLP